MKKHSIPQVLILLILIPALLLQGCFFPTPRAPAAPEPDAPEVAEDIPQDDSPPAESPQPGQFTLRYDPSSTLNPISALNRDNILISSLLYESLFELDGDFSAHPVLCESWSSEDNITFSFRIKPGIAMSDGSVLTADDVAYSLRQAMFRGRYIHRFSTVKSVTVAGDLVVEVELFAPNSRFTRLLDVPIIKNGAIDSLLPPGTGPYRLAEGETMKLERFLPHRDFSRLPLVSINLISCGDNELTELFDDGKLSLLWDDPSDAFDIRLNRLRETRYYDTTALQFIGFNVNHIVLRDAYIRRAISVSIERQHIIDSIMPQPNMAVAAPLALSPAFHLYDAEWERQPYPPLEEMALLLVAAGLEDADSDTFLELSDQLGGYYKFTIDFIVNSENTHKVRAAHSIANTLRRNGLDVTVRELTWDRFMNALQTGAFDMYYGETMIGADFNLAPLLLPGALNYGKTASADYGPFIADFLAAQSDYSIQWAAKRLVDEVRSNAPFAPILYKRYAVYTPIGAISGAEPSQSSVFRNFINWKINPNMLI